MWKLKAQARTNTHTHTQNNNIRIGFHFYYLIYFNGATKTTCLSGMIFLKPECFSMLNY